MKDRNHLLKELQILEDLEYAEQYDGRSYAFRIDEGGMICGHGKYPELQKAFPGHW